jgi:hypothetical protein
MAATASRACNEFRVRFGRNTPVVFAVRAWHLRSTVFEVVLFVPKGFNTPPFRARLLIPDNLFEFGCLLVRQVNDILFGSRHTVTVFLGKVYLETVH